MRTVRRCNQPGPPGLRQELTLLGLGRSSPIIRAYPTNRKDTSMLENDLAPTSSEHHPATTVQPLDTIRSYHAHIYFDGPEQRRVAEILREEIARRFSVLIGRWHDRPVGPHVRPMYQVAFSPVEFGRFVPWLTVNRRGVAVLIHPNTGKPKLDHLAHGMWLGEILDINSVPLRDHVEPGREIVPNTQPTVKP
jgi:aromatic ring-cleaving dioxygenase